MKLTGVVIVSRTAAKYSSKDALRRCLGCPDAALACSTPVGDDPARGSGRRGRRFKSCHPDQRRRSLTCANAALRWPAFHSGPPADAPKEQKRNTREPQVKPGPTSKNTRPPRTAPQTPRHRRDRRGNLIPRPQRRGRLVGRPARQEAVPIRSRQARQARDRQRAPPSAEDQVDPSALNDGIGQDVRMVRIVLWWTGLAASVLLVVAAFVSQSGTCVDSSNAAASSCSRQGSGGLLLVGLAAFALSSWMLRRAYRVRRSGDATR